MRNSKDTAKIVGSGEKSSDEPQEWKLNNCRAYI